MQLFELIFDDLDLLVHFSLILVHIFVFILEVIEDILGTEKPAHFELIALLLKELVEVPQVIIMTTVFLFEET